MLAAAQVDTMMASYRHTPVAMRDPDLQRLIDTTAAALESRIAPASRLAVLSRNIFDAAAAEVGTPPVNGGVAPLAVCRHLAPALVTAATGSPETAAVADALSHLGARLQWGRRIQGANDPEGFAENHANAVFVGHGGLEERDDIRIGASLVAPGTRYPDHDHPPEEMYLALSPGEWWNAETDWHEPGIGGLVHNPPGIVHAMRSGAAPLLAIWFLWSP